MTALAPQVIDIPTSLPPLTLIDTRTLIENRARIIECMRTAMTAGIHYGTLPGTDKPALRKPGAELILALFNLGARPLCEELSALDEIRYRVAVEIFNRDTQRTLGVGIGECSSSEAKYHWRKPVCTEEFEETPEERRRAVWKHGDHGPIRLQQVRVEPADVANTILKMAKKRGLVDATLTVTAASDVFSQDFEDLPPEWNLFGEGDDEGAESPDARATPQPLKREEAGGAAGARVESVRVAKTGKNKDGAWSLYIVRLTDGREAKTFDGELAGEARALQQSRALIAAFKTEETDRGTKLLGFGERRLS
jgi:hypothetical protein